MQKIGDDDHVVMTVVFGQGFCNCRCYRKNASEFIKDWATHRKESREGGPEQVASRLWLDKVIYWVDHYGKDDLDYASWAFIPANVVGVYVSELPNQEAYERYTKAVEKMADAAEQEIKRRDAGDEWKEGGEGES